MHERRFDGDISRLRSLERVERLEVERVTSLCLEEGNASSVLDVGTGSALFAESFSKHGLEVSGVDANPVMITAAQKYVPEGSFREGVVEALPYPDNSFDLVFLGLVLHEADELSKALQEVHRVARDKVCILEWPYKEQTFGPPLTDRLDPMALDMEFTKAGFHEWTLIELNNTVLYRLEV